MNASKGNGRRIVGRIVFTQLGIAVLLAAMFWGFSGLEAAYSAFAGGAISAVASFYMGRRVLAPADGRQPRRLLRGFFFGEAIKFLLTAALFLVGIVALNLSPLPMFVAYAAALLAYFFALLLSDLSSD